LSVSAPTSRRSFLLGGASALATAGDLRREVASIAASAGGTMGVCIRHLRTGETIRVNDGERFPMQSVYKLPIAMAVLHAIDSGKALLEDEVRLELSDARPGFSPLAVRLPITLTVRQLLTAVLIDSDNTASDRLLRYAGGPAAVQRYLRSIGITGIDVSRYEGVIVLDYYGVQDRPPEHEWSLPMFERLAAAVPREVRRAAARRYAADQRDTATPQAMVELLAGIHSAKLLKADTNAMLLGLMRECSRAANRLKGLLPPATPVAHRPGTGGTTDGINACTNDCGLITLPGGEVLAVAVLLKSSKHDLETRERAIAKVARAAYDAWTATSSAASRPRLWG
jgi:beta-lactamase class A